MAYKKETLAKFVEKARGTIEKRMNESFITVSLSKGNRKIGHVLNVSIMPIITCGNCTGCATYCYDVKACLQYGNVIEARARNTALMRTNIDEYFHQIDLAMKRRKKNLYMRWHVGGEIPSYEYFEKMVENAWNHPEYKAIWTYTKMYFIVAEYIRLHGNDPKVAFPSNFHVMLSEWRGMPMYNPYHLPEFRVVFTSEGEQFPSDCTWKCPGNCDICKSACRGCVVGETTHAADH